MTSKVGYSFFMKGARMNHYITKYQENGKIYVEAWLQINLFGKAFCFSRKRIEIKEQENE